MAAKKTNFISYELKQLEEYYDQLNTYLKKNPPDLAVDRVEYIDTPRGGQTIKVIASREAQVKLFTETLEKLPKILTDINLLRKSVDGLEEKNVRGGQDIPGFMKDDDDEDDVKDDYIEQAKKKKIVFEDDDENEKPIVTEEVVQKALPASTKKDEKVYDFTKTDTATDATESDDDPDFWDEDLQDE